MHGLSHPVTDDLCPPFIPARGGQLPVVQVPGVHGPGLVVDRPHLSRRFVADLPVDGTDVKARRYRAVLQRRGRILGGKGPVGLENHQIGKLLHHAGDGGVAAVHGDFVEVRKILRRRLAVLGDAGIDGLVAAVAVEKHTGIGGAVVRLGKPHRGHLGPQAFLGRVPDLHIVDALGRGFQKGNGSLGRVHRVLARRHRHAVLLHPVDGRQLLFRQMEVQRRAVGGKPHPPLGRQPVDVFQLGAAAGGAGRRHHQRNIPLHGFGRPRAVPHQIFMAVEDVQLVGKGQKGHGAVGKGCQRLFFAAVRQLPHLAAGGGQHPAAAGQIAAPQAPDRAGEFPDGFQTRTDAQMVLGRYPPVFHQRRLSQLQLGIAVQGFIDPQKPLNGIVPGVAAGLDGGHTVTVPSRPDCRGPGPAPPVSPGTRTGHR